MALTVVLYSSGAVAALANAASRVTGGGVELVSLDASRQAEIERIRAIAAEVAAEQKKPSWQVTAEELQKSEKIKKLGLDEMQAAVTIQAALSQPPSGDPHVPKLDGFKPVDFSDKKSTVYNYAVLKQPAVAPDPSSGPQPTVAAFGDEYGSKKFFVYKLEIKRKPTTGPDGKPLPETAPQTVFFGPIEESELSSQIEAVKAQVEVKKLEIDGTGKTSVPARFYANKDGELALVIEGKVPNPHRIVNRGALTYFRIPVDELKEYMKERDKDSTKPMPPSEQAVVATLTGG